MNLGEVLQHIETWILSMSAEAWVYPATYLLTVVDGFFPPVPSESVVITLTVAARTTGSPSLFGVLLVAILGAWCGDQIAFAIGRKVGTDRVRFLRGERGQATVRWARRALGRRGASFIIAARYIPIGRIAVNMTAGAVGYPRRRFMEYSAVAAVLWGVYALGMGLLASVWLHEHPLLAMAVGIALGVLVGLLIERCVRWVLHRRGEAVDEPADDATDDGAPGATASEAAPAAPNGPRPS